MISPLSLLAITDVEEPIPAIVGAAHADTPFAILLYIVGIYRLEPIRNDDYRDRIIRNITTQQTQAGSHRTVLNIQGVENYGGWVKNAAFRTLMAALDMFFIQFPNEEYAQIRVGTLVSRFKDCGALQDVMHFKKTMGCDELATWIFIREAAREIHLLMIPTFAGKDGTFFRFFSASRRRLRRG